MLLLAFRDYIISGDIPVTSPEFVALLDRFAAKARLEEARWWEHLVPDVDHTEADCVYCKRIAELERLAAGEQADD